MSQSALPKLNPLWLVSAVVILVVAALAVIVFPRRVAAGYFLGFISALQIALGAMGILLIHVLSGGAWEKWLETPSRSAVAVLPVFALLTIPLWFCMDVLFPWAGDSRQTVKFSAHQALWLQSIWQMVRIVIYFVIWLGIAAGLAVWVAGRPVRMSIGAAAVSLIAYILVSSLFAVDWIMSITPESTSSMIGFLVVSEQWVAALAVAALWMSCRGQGVEPGDAEKRARIDIGNLLLAAIMFHAYCLFMDYLIVWEANLPSEIGWYLSRARVFHGFVIVSIALLFVALPILLLLFRRIKSSARGLGSISTMVLLGHFLMVAWYIAPLFEQNTETPNNYWVWQLLEAAGFFGACGVIFYGLVCQFQRAKNAEKLIRNH